MFLVGLVGGAVVGLLSAPRIHRVGGQPAPWKAALGTLLGFIAFLVIPDDWQAPALGAAVAILAALVVTSPKLRGRRS